jgi:acetylornithine deacetylase/succinyl-diaminopimelate desuccinylase-like protein
MFVAEGEEEIGSPHFPQIVERYRARLAQAHAVFDAEAGQNIHGRVRMVLGNKGIVYLELRCAGERWGRGPQTRWLHSSRKVVVDSPAWRLVHALSTLTVPDGNTVAIPGFYDHVAQPTAEDEELLRQLAPAFDEAGWKEEWDVAHFVDELSGEALLRRYYFSPSLNIDGLWSGYTGPGTLTVVPHEATCKLDFRLVPDMHSGEIVPGLRDHLERHGYADVEIRVRAAYEWSKTSPTAAIVRAIREVYERRGVACDVWPLTAGSAPMYLFTRAPLRLPMAGGGLGHGGRNHAHDEYLVIEGDGRVAGLVEAEQSYVDILYAYAEMAA